MSRVPLREVYSHSRLSSFEQCPQKFEYRYVLKLPSDSEGIEGFTGPDSRLIHSPEIYLPLVQLGICASVTVENTLDLDLIFKAHLAQAINL